MTKLRWPDRPVTGLGEPAPDGEARRLRLYQHNRPHLQYALARMPPLEEPMILFIVDATDTLGRMMAEHLDPDGMTGDGEIPPIVAAYDPVAARVLVADHPGVVEALMQPPVPGTIPVVVIAGEGALCMQMGIDPGTPIPFEA